MISKELRPYFQGRLRITAFSWFSGFLRAKDSLQEAFNLVGQFRHKAGPDETVNVVKDKLGPWLLSVPDYDLAGALWNTNIPLSCPLRSLRLCATQSHSLYHTLTDGFMPCATGRSGVCLKDVHDAQDGFPRAGA